MSTIFGSVGGCYVKYSYGSSSSGADDGSGIMFDGFSSMKGVIATGFNLRRRDSNFIQRCLGGKNYVYGFGQDIGEMSVSALAVVLPAKGASGSGSGTGSLKVYSEGADFKAVQQNYVANSLTEKGFVTVSAFGSSIPAFLISLTVETQKAETNVHACQFDFYILDK